jgi:AcrR family transcriptional regulator
MSITVSKTRDILVDVARQLFARMGVDRTTMNDIAQASRKGRRTLYTYFKNKDDLFLAVVESELDKLNRTLCEIAAMQLPADEKLITFIYTRLEAVKTIVFRNGTLRAGFFRDSWRVAKARKRVDSQEMEIIGKILDDGLAEGTFEMPDTNVTALILHYALKGLEVPYIRGFMGSTEAEQECYRKNVVSLIFNGIKVKKQCI